MVFGRFGSAGLLCLLATTALAQGGQAGGGFGGGGLGVGPATGDEVHRSLILTPGDKGEWILDAQEGEVVIANAKSSVFDPALEVVDEQNKVLASNDDIEPGVQSARLLYRFAKAGKYRVWVKGYKSAAGGPFDITLRRFLPISVEMDKTVTSVLDETGSQWFRFRGSKGKPLAVKFKAMGYSPELDIIGPTGETFSDDGSDVSRTSRFDLRKVGDADYFARVRGRSAAKASIEFSISLIPMNRVELGANAKSKLLTGETEINFLEVSPGDLIRVDAASAGPKVWFRLGTLEDEQSEEYIHHVYSSAVKANWEVFLVKKKGTVAITVSQWYGLSTEYALAISRPARSFESPIQKAQLAMGNIDYYTFKGSKGDLVQLSAQSKQFDTHIRLLGPDGKSLGELDDTGESTDSVMTALIPEGGAFTVAVASSGMGRAGEYTLERRVIAPTPIPVGAIKTGTLRPGETQVWVLSGKAGEMSILNTKSSTSRLNVQVFGPGGERVGKAVEEGLVILKVGTDGAYTIWVTADQGGGDYRIQVIDLAK